MDVVTTSRRRLHGRETQVKRGCHVIRSETQEIETRAAEWIYWKTPTLICCRLNMLRSPLHHMLECLWFLASLFVFLLCVAFLCMLTRFGCWSQWRRQQKAWFSSDIFPLRMWSSERCHTVTYTRCTAHTALIQTEPSAHQFLLFSCQIYKWI